MNIIDPKFKKHALTYFLQCLLAAVLIFMVLYLVEMFSNMVVIASLGASAFIALSFPKSPASNAGRLIGGYAAGSLCGVAMHYTNRFLIENSISIFNHAPHVLTCACAVGLAMLVMTALNLEHPPAAALAMGLVTENDAFAAIFVAMLSISAISLFKFILKKWLKDL